ncbi:IS110 family transposase [Suttonella ornithocola]|uniref:Transposase n=1 Tax=Suttonella ornithocola TaxID=279832 RepID=A0A380MY42_9GAMM|nr:IS110 family transposase [Suttonella ornithocola]SUO96357.1 Transposase [Suttonella ornithocola]
MIYIGLDISKYSIDVCELNGDSAKSYQLDNSPAGYNELINRLNNLSDKIHVCCEYTGIYYYAIANALYQANITISVVNAYSIKSYARLTLSRTKTDKQDAKLIAQYCKINQPEPWQPPKEQAQMLKNLTRRLEQLTKLRTMELNRQKVAETCVSESIEIILSALNQEINRIEQQLQNYISQSAELNNQQQRLTTIIGIGKKTANVLLSVLCEIERFPSYNHLVSYLGLSPIIVESGSSVRSKSRISKMGDKFVRKSLYLPALTACKRSKLFKPWFEYHQSRGKHPKQIYVMMMRKLVIYAYHVIKHDTYFDPSKIQFHKNNII